MPDNIIILRQPGLVPVARSDAHSALPEELLRLPSTDVEADMQSLTERLRSPEWQSHDPYLRAKASEVLDAARQLSGKSEVHYFGIAEIPHVIGLGAYLGDELPVVLYEYDRDASLWRTGGELSEDVEVVGLPEGPPVPVSGSASIRIEVSSRVADDLVRSTIGTDLLADVRISVPEPTVGRVKGSRIAEFVRQETRRVLGRLQNSFPMLREIHLFVAAPNSVCFGVGQAIKPRNTAPCWTYQFRVVEGVPQYRRALCIRHDPIVAPAPLNDDQLFAARVVRTKIAPQALQQVRELANALNVEQPWSQALNLPRVQIENPFPELPVLAKLIGTEIVAANVETAEFAFVAGEWHLGDRLLWSWSQQFSNNEADIARALRLFFTHEYLHIYQGVHGSRARLVGQFANCLEYVDYVADYYALLHEAHWSRSASGTVEKRIALADLIDFMLRAIWAFDHGTGVEWQMRRLRRYLNWYWQLGIIERGPSEVEAMRVLARVPRIEFAGLDQYVRDQWRLVTDLERSRSRPALELAVITDRGLLKRLPSSTTLPLGDLVDRFLQHDHSEIGTFFRAVHEHVDEFHGL